MMNLFGLYLMCYVVVLMMKVCGDGYIVNIVLIVLKCVWLNVFVYYVMKWGLFGLLYVLYVELWLSGVCVLVIVVGGMCMLFLFDCFLDIDEEML